MNCILDALDCLDVAKLPYIEWINVGMALKTEGYGVEVWDEWSKKDSRYKPGECMRKWNTFNGATTPITGGTIMQLAKSYGYSPRVDGAMEWDATISDDDTVERLGSHELITYIETLFKKDEYVGYVTGDVWQNEDGKWLPKQGVFSRTAGELIDALRKYPEDIGAAIGDWKEDAGAWIRFNPFDGKGIKNENVTRFRYALVESDSMSLTEQKEAYERLEIPIACLVHSGGKSLHAIVKIDAENYDEYRNRVDYLYSFLEKQGVVIDKQNRNPSRLSRMPGVTRNGIKQALLATNIGKSNWAEWVAFSEEYDDDLPELEPLGDALKKPIVLPEPIIEGILRRGHKMLISGSSKAGKSFLLMELCVSIAEGVPWLGFGVRQGKVLYVNLEIDGASCFNRFNEIYKALKLNPHNANSIEIWNLRGKALPLDKLTPKLIRRAKSSNFDVIVIDPIYKIITGDENSALEMAKFCNNFDMVCRETGCATIYCHHHSKGAQGFKRAMDRASGSGVFARDPDAQLDMIELQLEDALKNQAPTPNATAWRLESSLREFPNIIPVDFWFSYPIHVVDEKGRLKQTPPQGTKEAALIKNGKLSTPESRLEDLKMAYLACSINGDVSLHDIAEYLGKADRTIRDHLKEFKDVFKVDKNIVRRIDS